MIKQRDSLTEDEHIKLIQIGDVFWDHFSRLCGEFVSKMPAELESITVEYLGDKTSIYGSQYRDFVVRRSK